jgi:galactose mutarotase-like enzyme
MRGRVIGVMLPGVEVVTLRAGELEADYVPRAGMVCASLRHRGEELLGQRKGLEAYAAQGSTFALPLLYPWANRVAARTFDCLGRTVDLAGAPPGVFRDDGETGLPIHGARTAGGPWDVEHRDEASLRASFDWSEHPELLAAFPFEHRVTYAAELTPEALRVTMRVEGEAPVALGFHPYFSAPAGTRFEVLVRERLVLDEHKLPTGEREPVDGASGVVGEDAFDDGYSAPEGPFTDGDVTVTLERGFPYCQLFAPPGAELVAFEPMSAPTNALVTGDELPEAPWEGAFVIGVSP